MPNTGNNHTTALPGDNLLQLEGISHTYPTTVGSRPTLHNVSLSVMRGQSCAIVGASGSGKSTLLNIIGLLDQPTSGRLLLDGQDMTRATAHIRAQTRNQRIGFVFQSFNLLPRLSALENVALPLLYRGHGHTEAQRLALQEVTRVGLVNRAHHRPAELSGGQRQRIAIARALVGHPDLILADEPTGNLDSNTAGEVLALLQALNREQGVTLVIVTHDESLAQTLQRCLLVKDGHLLERYPNPVHA